MKAEEKNDDFKYDNSKYGSKLEIQKDRIASLVVAGDGDGINLEESKRRPFLDFIRDKFWGMFYDLEARS